MNHIHILEQKYYNLFEDYPQLHPEAVANSCKWYNTWSAESYTSENMVLTFVLLQNNTEADLWGKCIELYESFSEEQQGGPLMLCLILRRIRDHSEQALDIIKVKIQELKITSIEGEDVDAIKSAVNELEQASHALSKAMYEQTGSNGAQAADATDAPVDAAAEDDAIDAEFEVKND